MRDGRQDVLGTSVRGSEGKTRKSKREQSFPDGALKTLAALANTAGGTLLLGVEGRRSGLSPKPTRCSGSPH